MESADNVSKHRALVDSRQFERGADFAMLEYTSQLAQQTDSQYAAMAGGLKMQGALEFLAIFKKLAEAPVTAPKLTLSSNLTEQS